MKLIPLTQGKFAKVDDSDFERLKGFSWQAVKEKNGFYARKHHLKVQGKWTKIRMHALLLSPAAGQEVDHIDGDGLNNQRVNLRVCSKTQNARGFRVKRVGVSSRFKGVCWDASRSKWRANIKFGGKQNHIGRFDSEEDAARAYDAAALEHFGDFACPNFKRVA